jgi:hypothetical protein
MRDLVNSSEEPADSMFRGNNLFINVRSPTSWIVRWMFTTKNHRSHHESVFSLKKIVINGYIFLGPNEMKKNHLM